MSHSIKIVSQKWLSRYKKNTSNHHLYTIIRINRNCAVEMKWYFDTKKGILFKIFWSDSRIFEFICIIEKYTWNDHKTRSGEMFRLSQSIVCFFLNISSSTVRFSFWTFFFIILLFLIPFCPSNRHKYTKCSVLSPHLIHYNDVSTYISSSFTLIRTISIAWTLIPTIYGNFSNAIFSMR